MIQIRQPKHSATVIRLDSVFAHSDGLPCRSIWDDGGQLDVAKSVALRSGLGVLSAIACYQYLHPRLPLQKLSCKNTDRAVF
jgi:hypothetical protein